MSKGCPMLCIGHSAMNGEIIMKRTLYLNARIVTMDKQDEIIDGCMLIEGSKIKYIGPFKETLKKDEVIDCKNNIIMPSFINAHAHSPMTLFRGYAEGLALSEWLNDYIFPAEQKLDDDCVYWATMLALYEQAKNGITSTSDMYFFCDSIAQAVKDSGCKMNIARSISCMENMADYSKYYSVVEAENLLEKYPYTKKGAIMAECSVHSEYTTNPGVCAKVLELAKKHHTSINLHLSETQSEQDQCILRHSLTPMQYFEQLGYLTVPLTLAHCVYVTPDDIKVMQKGNVTVAHCPVSNLKLASGIAPVPQLLNRGINVALGTDSVTSNNNLNFLEEIKLAAILHKGINKDPKLINSFEALKMATVNGAKCQGRQDQCGKIKVGFDADFIILNSNECEFIPSFSIYDQVVFSATPSNIVMTVCQGKTLYKNGVYTAFDYDTIKHQFNRVLKKIYNK